jgi:protein gp37
METKIEWTDETWNPIRGCSRVSEGCRNCYAEKVAYRFSGPGQPYEGLVQVAKFDHSIPGIEVKTERRLPLWNGSIKFVEEHLLDPLRWKKPRRIFVNSMSDLFHENVTDEMRDRIFAVMALCPQHTFQVLTKRPKRMLAYCSEMQSCWVLRLSHAINTSAQMCDAADAPNRPMTGWPLRNVWLGVSVEDQKAANERIPLLLQTPAAVRFISAEPLLGPTDLFKVPRPDVPYFQWRGETGAIGPKNEPDDYVYWMKRLLHWVICGGESGPGARPMHPDWARSLRDQCVAAGVPFFFKQWGQWAPYATRFAGDNDERGKWDDAVNRDGSTGHVAMTSDGSFTNYSMNLTDGFYVVSRVGKKAAGHLLDGKEWHQFPADVR